MDARYCADCTHFRGSWNLDPSTCERPLTDRRSIVSGELVDRVWSSCRRERKSGHTFWTRRERCGPTGKFWEAR